MLSWNSGRATGSRALTWPLAEAAGFDKQGQSPGTVKNKELGLHYKGLSLYRGAWLFRGTRLGQDPAVVSEEGRPS